MGCEERREKERQVDGTWSMIVDKCSGRKVHGREKERSCIRKRDATIDNRQQKGNVMKKTDHNERKDGGSRKTEERGRKYMKGTTRRIKIEDSQRADIEHRSGVESEGETYTC